MSLKRKHSCDGYFIIIFLHLVCWHRMDICCCGSWVILPAGLPSTHLQASSPPNPGPAWTQRSGRNTTFMSRLRTRRANMAWLKSLSPSSTWTTTLQSLMKSSLRRPWSLAPLSKSRYIMLYHLVHPSIILPPWLSVLNMEKNPLNQCFLSTMRC